MSKIKRRLPPLFCALMVQSLWGKKTAFDGSAGAMGIVKGKTYISLTKERTS